MRVCIVRGITNLKGRASEKTFSCKKANLRKSYLKILDKINFSIFVSFLIWMDIMMKKIPCHNGKVRQWMNDNLDKPFPHNYCPSSNNCKKKIKIQSYIFKV